MKPDDADIRDEALARSLRAAMATERAPRSWVDEALTVPARFGARRAARRESKLVLVLPHLCGLALLVGLALAMSLSAARMAPAWAAVRSVLPGNISLDWVPVGIPPEILIAALFTPLLFYVLFQGAQGFPAFRARRHR
jgi:hypothetical protein